MTILPLNTTCFVSLLLFIEEYRTLAVEYIVAVRSLGFLSVTQGEMPWHSTWLTLSKCEREYHVGCVRAHKRIDLKDLPCGICSAPWSVEYIIQFFRSWWHVGR
ncbi:unnamed protein product [Lactuca virosa]|uniref:Secreted protein n=1 Tax=Lactuca virosa TaxID=75947 RepID=A0AAU9NRP7_9ASTR|nr:unnamed protein product [Lactuca virosa]